jgi:Mn-containing catalase
MNPKEFMKLLNEARELMTQEKYTEAIVILENLKSSDKSNESDFNYELVHQLYQLDSNCKSAYHQQRILEIIKNLPIPNNSIKLEEIYKVLRVKENLDITEEILRREVELLILRNLLNCKIEGDQLIFNDP